MSKEQVAKFKPGNFVDYPKQDQRYYKSVKFNDIGKITDVRWNTWMEAFVYRVYVGEGISLNFQEKDISFYVANKPKARPTP